MDEKDQTWDAKFFEALKTPKQTIVIAYQTWQAARRAQEGMMVLLTHTVKNKVLAKAQIGHMLLLNGTKIIFTTKELIEKGEIIRGHDNIVLL